jgi:hypothetical protein
MKMQQICFITFASKLMIFTISSVMFILIARI